jgi:hypothetical protein
VDGGGLLIASLDSTLYDERGQRRADFGLADVFGASFRGAADAYRNFNYLEVVDPSHPVAQDLSVRLIAAPDYGLRVEPSTADVVARFRAPLAGRYEPMTPLAWPAVLWNQCARGHCLYLVGTFGEFYLDYAVLEYQQLVCRALERFAPPPVRVWGAPPSLEVVVRAKRDGSAVLVHLVNYTGGMTRPIQQALPLRGMRLSIDPAALPWRVQRAEGLPWPAQRAQALVSGASLSLVRTDRGLELELPEIAGEYEVVVVRP